MKKSIGLFLLLAWMVIILPVQSFAAGPKITEAEVKAFLKGAESATQNRDYAQVINYMSPDIVIQFEINGRPINLSREQYYQNAIGGAANYSDYQYHSTVKSVAFVGDQAKASASATEKITSTEQGTIYCMMNQLFVVERRNGQLKITQYLVNGNMSKDKLF